MLSPLFFLPPEGEEQNKKPHRIAFDRVPRGKNYLTPGDPLNGKNLLTVNCFITTGYVTFAASGTASRQRRPPEGVLQVYHRSRKGMRFVWFFGWKVKGN
jgi:hypothetical protein